MAYIRARSGRGGVSFIPDFSTQHHHYQDNMSGQSSQGSGWVYVQGGIQRYNPSTRSYEGPIVPQATAPSDEYRPQSSSSVVSEVQPATPSQDITRVSQHRPGRQQGTLFDGLNFPVPGQAPVPFNSPPVNPYRPWGGHRPHEAQPVTPNFGSSPPDYPGSLRNMSESPTLQRVNPSDSPQSLPSGTTASSGQYRSPPPSTRNASLAEIRSYPSSLLTRAQANLVNSQETRESVLAGIAQDVREVAWARGIAPRTGRGSRQ